MKDYLELDKIMYEKQSLKEAFHKFDHWTTKYAIGDWIEYPSNEDKLNGIKDGEAWLYIGENYLNGLINYTNVVYGVGKIDVGEDPDKRQTYVRNLHTFASFANANSPRDDMFKSYPVEGEEYGKILTTNSFHTNVADTSYFPHMQVLATGAGSYWYFDSDMDCSDCGLARFKDDIFTDERQASDWFLCYLAENAIFEDEEIQARYKLYSEVEMESLRHFVNEYVCNKYLVCIPPKAFGGWITL